MRSSVVVLLLAACPAKQPPGPAAAPTPASPRPASPPCHTLGGTPIFPLDADPATRLLQAQAAVCQASADRATAAAAVADASTSTFDYVFIGGGFATQNILANAPAEVRAASVILSIDTPGILYGSQNPGQPWELIFTGLGPPDGDAALAGRWVDPIAFKPLFVDHLNTTRAALEYTHALNELALGVPVVPCWASDYAPAEIGGSVTCTSADGTVSTVHATRQVVAAIGMGPSSDLDPSEITPEHQDTLRTATVNGIPRLLTEREVFAALDAGRSFGGASLFVIGGGNAAASSVTDLLDPEITPPLHQPASILLLAQARDVWGPNFAPAVYWRARGAALCSLGNPAPPESCSGVTMLPYGGRATASVVPIGMDAGPITGVRVSYCTDGTGTCADPESVDVDHVVTAIGNTSTIRGILPDSAALRPVLTTDYLRQPDGYGDIALGDAGLLIGAIDDDAGFALAGSSLVTATRVEGLFADDRTRDAATDYLLALRAVYDQDRDALGGITNVNSGALLYNGWPTAEVGARLTPGTGATSLPALYQPARDAADASLSDGP